MPDSEQPRQADILRYWRAVEYFSPQTVDRVDPRKDVSAAWAGTPLPWESGSRLGRPRRNCVWRHTVYAGIFMRLSSLREVFGQGSAGLPIAHGCGRARHQHPILLYSLT